MTPERIAELLEICEKALSGKWIACDIFDDGKSFGVCDKEGRIICRPGTITWQDAHFIATARTALPEALAEIQRLQAELKIANESLTEVYMLGKVDAARAAGRD